MIASEILAKGVERGIITAQQAERLRALQIGVREPSELPVSPDDEQLRFISGFSDIFVTIGLAMFLGAIGYLALAVRRPTRVCGSRSPSRHGCWRSSSPGCGAWHYRASFF